MAAPLARRAKHRATPLHLPPAGRMAALTGSPEAVAELLAALEPPAGAEVLGTCARDRPGAD